MFLMKKSFTESLQRKSLFNPFMYSHIRSFSSALPIINNEEEIPSNSNSKSSKNENRNASTNIKSTKKKWDHRATLGNVKSQKTPNIYLSKISSLIRTIQKDNNETQIIHAIEIFERNKSSFTPPDYISLIRYIATVCRTRESEKKSEILPESQFLLSPPSSFVTSLPQSESLLLSPFERKGIKELYTEAISVIDSLEIQSFARFVWATKYIGIQFKKESKEIISSKILKFLREFTSCELVSVSWAISYIDFEDKNLMECLLNEIASRDLKFFYPFEISMILQVVTAQKVDRPDIFDKVTKHFEENVSTMDLSTVFTVGDFLHAYAFAGRSDDIIFESFLQAIPNKASSFILKPSPISQILWSLAVIEKPIDNKVLEAITKDIDHFKYNFNIPEISSILWSFTSLNEEESLLKYSQIWLPPLAKLIIKNKASCKENQVELLSEIDLLQFNSVLFKLTSFENGTQLIKENDLLKIVN